MNYEKITTCDIANGLGIGVVLWVSGCDIHCKGCHNKETWDFNSGKLFDEKALDDLYCELNKPYITRCTISGGHPIAPENYDICESICRNIKLSYPKVDIWLYTGYVWEDIKNYNIFNYVDVVVDGPYIEEERDLTLPFRGSRNQRLIDVKQSKNANKIVIL